ncbi:MAG: type II/IV secretion system protein, partial [Burkholderiaceae bacterium]|nr:type II/IV secretion system protein [Burkholderiaceae bacterium]
MNAPDVKKAGALPNGRLPLSFVVKGLVADGLMARADAERVLSVRERASRVHPLALLAEMNLRAPTPGRELLDIERLTQWLAEKARLPYQHIDPLRVDFARVVEVMSASYATNYSILPIAVNSAEVTVATCEPFLDGWVREIEQISRKSVKRVVANPLDIERYTIEFYKLAQSIKSASRTAEKSVVGNFEQLVELGSKVDAENHHIVTIVDWLLQY